MGFVYDTVNFEHQKILCVKYLKGWEQCHLEDIDVKDCSCFGGNRTYILSCDTAEPKKAVVHGRKVAWYDFFGEARILAAHQQLWHHGLVVPRYCSGTTWWIEPFFENVSETKMKEKDFTLEFARALARLHVVPTFWNETWKNQTKRFLTCYKKVNDGSHCWVMNCKVAWLLMFGDHAQFIIDATVMPLHPAAKRIVTVHGDYNTGNVLIDKDGNFLFADQEFTHTAYAVYDIAYAITLNALNMRNPKERYLYCETYLRELGYETDKENVELFVFDVQCAALRYFNYSILMEESNKSKDINGYDFDYYRLLQKFEMEAREKPEIITFIANSSFEEAGEKFDEKIRQYQNNKYEHLELACYFYQLLSKREFMSVEQENLMEKDLFEKHNIVRLATNKTMRYQEVTKFASENAGGLLTADEIKTSGLNLQDMNFWMYVKNEDTDACCLGKPSETLGKARYACISDNNADYLSEYGKKKISFYTREPDFSRPIKYIYAKRDPKKNKEFIPLNTAENDKNACEAAITSLRKQATENFCQYNSQIIENPEEYGKFVKELEVAHNTGLIAMYMPLSLPWAEAKELAGESGYKLPTCEDFEKAGYNTGAREYWMYCHSDDDSQRFCQLGSYYMREGRYYDNTAVAFHRYWFNIYSTDPSKPSKIFFAKAPQGTIPPFKNILEDERLFSDMREYFTAYFQKNLRKNQSEQEETDQISSERVKGVQRLPIDQAVTWEQADELATSLGLSLPTLNDLKKKDICVYVDDYMTFIKNKDGSMNGVQLGLGTKEMDQYECVAENGKNQQRTNSSLRFPKPNWPLKFLHVVKKQKAGSLDEALGETSKKEK